MQTPTLFTTFQVENRSVRSATATGFIQGKTGIPTEQFYEIYQSLSKGHPGLIIMEHSFVAMRGHAGHNQLGIHNDDMIQYHKKAIDMMRQANPKIKICCQLAHAGPNGGEADKIDINSAKPEEFVEVVKQFGEAAVRAVKAGYDCVQIHGAHTYLLSQTLSSYFNKRTDEYKASDFKLLTDVLAEVKKCGIPTGVKLQCDDFIEGETMNAQQAVKIVKALNFDFVEMSGGGYLGNAKYGTIRQGKDVYYYRHVVEEFNKEFLMQKQPVIVTGGFDMEIAKEGLRDGATMIGFSRKFLRNDAFMQCDNKKCGKCGQCIGGLLEGGEATCIFVKKEKEAKSQ